MQNSNQSSEWLTFPAQQYQNDSLQAFHSLLNSESSSKASKDLVLDVDLQTHALFENNENPNVETMIEAFEEDACSSWSEDPQQKEIKEISLDDVSQTSISQKSEKDLKSNKHSCSQDHLNQSSVVSEKLIEYMWPPVSGELYIMLQQLNCFLKDKSLENKVGDLDQRIIENDEKRYLIDKGVITDSHHDVDIIALRSQDVLLTMSKNYPEYYEEFIKILRNSGSKNVTDKLKDVSSNSSDKNKMIDLAKKAVQSAADYNAHLNQERREDRKSCMDLQTFTIHYPSKKIKIKQTSKPGKYPVALLPGQYQDYYQEFTPSELKYLPVNTVLFGPLSELNSIKVGSDGSQSDSDDSIVSDDSESSSPGTHDDSSSSSEKNKIQSSPLPAKIKPNATCKVCKLSSESNLEELIYCSDCENSAHPSCIELTPDVVSVIMTYPWQCMDCKICSHCRDPNDEDKMLFCDTCDRGYHTFCVGLKNLPQGKWICRQCGSCSMCGASKPGPDASKAQWHYETPKANESNPVNYKPKLFCLCCFKKKH